MPCWLPTFNITRLKKKSISTYRYYTVCNFCGQFSFRYHFKFCQDHGHNLFWREYFFIFQITDLQNRSKVDPQWPIFLTNLQECGPTYIWLVLLQVTLPWEQDIQGALALPPFAPHRGHAHRQGREVMHM